MAFIYSERQLLRYHYSSSGDLAMFARRCSWGHESFMFTKMRESGWHKTTVHIAYSLIMGRSASLNAFCQRCLQGCQCRYEQSRYAAKLYCVKGLCHLKAGALGFITALSQMHARMVSLTPFALFDVFSSEHGFLISFDWLPTWKP